MRRICDLCLHEDDRGLALPSFQRGCNQREQKLEEKNVLSSGRRLLIVARNKKR
jgi:hypothetical protein